MCLFGPTASGKTELLFKLFNSHNAEVISADSMQVYRGMDIGTAKPSRRQRELLVHHLLDIKTPDQRYHVGEFVQSADALTAQISAAGRLPVVCGGTAFYIRTLLCGLPQAPAARPEVRDRLGQRLQSEGLDALYAELCRVDPESSARIASADRYRIVRALEIYHSCGVPRSQFVRPAGLRADVAPLVIAIDRPRSELYQRINRRVRCMFEQGLVAEVQALAAAGYGPDAPGLRAIGYREFFEHPRVAAEGVAAARDPEVAGAIETAIARNSRRYAKRQLTFFRQMPSVQWIGADSEQLIAERVAPLLRGNGATGG